MSASQTACALGNSSLHKLLNLLSLVRVRVRVKVWVRVSVSVRIIGLGLGLGCGLRLRARANGECVKSGSVKYWFLIYSFIRGV